MTRQLLAAMLLAGPLLGGPILYSSFGPGQSFSTDTGATLGLGAYYGNGGYSDAFDFIPGQSGQVASIAMAIMYVYQPPDSTGLNQLSVWLMADGPDGPGPVIESYNYSGPSGATILSIITLDSQLHPFLSAGTRYWLGAGPVDLLNSWYGWQNNDWKHYPPIYGNYSQKIGVGPWGPAVSGALTPAFEITAVPEPRTIALLVSGIALIAFRSRWRAVL